MVLGHLDEGGITFLSQAPLLRLVMVLGNVASPPCHKHRQSMACCDGSWQCGIASLTQAPLLRFVMVPGNVLTGLRPLPPTQKRSMLEALSQTSIQD